METTRTPPSTLSWVKGHATENDFVVLPDPEGTLELTPALVRALCSRRTGIGGDGVLRVVRGPQGGAPEAEWYMDHWNSDGSRPEMCGNGARLYGRYLVASGLAAPGLVRLGTGGGLRQVEVPPEGDVGVRMGVPRSSGDVEVSGRTGVLVDLGNPHAVVVVEDLEALGPLRPDREDLNVEYVQQLDGLHLALRVHERGVGETRSCGTGACAAVAAAGGSPGETWVVDVPGGRLRVRVEAGGEVVLVGPATLVSAGTSDLGAVCEPEDQPARGWREAAAPRAAGSTPT